REALERSPLYHAALHQTAHYLSLLDRNDEAIDVLAKAEPRLESAALALHLATLEGEQKRFEDEQRSLDRAEALSPLLEKEGADRLAGRRSDCAYGRGDLAAAESFARKCKNPFFQRLPGRLAGATPSRRVMREVRFVRQHHLTCVPATLSTLSRFWGREAAHLEIAEAICYDGTPAHSERRWAEENGYSTREFTVTWESATALLDRGVPFTLTTSVAAAAHLQAVIGYDDRRGTLYLRDPYLHVVGEAAADLLLDRLRSSG